MSKPGSPSWSQADILGCLRDVRHSPESEHRLSGLRCPLRAMNRHLDHNEKPRTMPGL